MKKLLLIAFMSIPFFGISQTTKPVDSFLGIKFGSSKEVVMAAMKAKGATFDKQNSTAEVLQFDHVKLGHRAASEFAVAFIDNKAYQGRFIFKVELEAKAIDYYNELVSDINEIYGKGQSYKKFKEPYKAGDGYEITAIQTGNADYQTFWTAENKNGIEAYIDSELQIFLIYEDDVLSTKAEAKQKKAEKSDF